MSDFSHLQKDERKSHFCNLVAAAHKDGKLTYEERIALAYAARKYGLTPQEADEISANPDRTVFVMPSSENASFHQLYDVIELMMIDGELKKIEKDLCRAMAARLGFAPDAFETFKDTILEGTQLGLTAEKIQSSLKRKLG